MLVSDHLRAIMNSIGLLTGQTFAGMFLRGPAVDAAYQALAPGLAQSATSRMESATKAQGSRQKQFAPCKTLQKCCRMLRIASLHDISV